jgi:hypothetical protein
MHFLLLGFHVFSQKSRGEADEWVLFSCHRRYKTTRHRVPEHYHHLWENNPFWTIAFRRSFCQISLLLDHPVLSLLWILQICFFLLSKIVSLVSNIRPGGPSPCIYIPQEQGGLVIPLGTGVSFRRILRLAGLRWRYWNLPPHRRFYFTPTDFGLNTRKLTQFTREVFGLSLGPDTNQPEWKCSRFSSVPPDKYHYSRLNKATIAISTSFPILYSLSSGHSTLLFLVWVTGRVC